MTFTLKLELIPGTTFAEIQRQVELVASNLPSDNSKPEHTHRIDIDYPSIAWDRAASGEILDAEGTLIARVRGEWRIDQ